MNCTRLIFILCLAFIVFPDAGRGQEARETVAGQGKSTAKTGEEVLKQSQIAADANPTDLNAQLNFAQQLHEQEKYKEAWQLLRGVYQKSPENLGGLIGMAAVMESYKRQGLLNIGTMERQVLELLGEPHHTRKMPWGTRHVYGMMAVDFREGKVYELIKLIGATNELFDASHVVDVDLGSNPPWHIGIRQKGDGLTTAFLFREGESIAQWNELVTIERFVGQAEGKTMKEIFAIVQEKIKADDSNASLIVAEQDESTVIFGINYLARDGQLPKQQLVRLWRGPRDVHRLAYTHKGEIPGQKEGEHWFKTIKNSSLKPYDPSVSPTSLASSPRSQVKNLAETIRTDLKKASRYRPTDEALRAIAATEESWKKLKAYCDSVYNELERAGMPGQPNQTEIIVFGPAVEDLPGGYNNARQHFKEEVKFYGFKYVVPGETSGMSFDGAFEVGGKWYFLPKAHRAFK